MPRTLLACLGLLLACLPASTAEPVAFNRDIRPILSDHCFACHGPDKSKRKADLRLDREEGAHGVVVPGKPDESELLERILATEPARRMPPAKVGRALSAREVDLLKRWIAQGAKWEPHWAYVAPKHPALPAVKNSSWVRTPLDAFVLARLEKEGLAPSPEASRTTLIRRVTLDLTGLPPTLQEVDDFLADHSPDAYEKVVERLLASPRYGERLALDWLDAARYADSNGYQQDLTRTLWPWRDWVVRAFNANMPFDRFTVEQIAGDLLPGATLDQKIATGFNRNHMLNGEGGRIAEESRIDYVVDRVDTTATVFLGLTLGCARCHDHKFDPFTQKDFYRFFAYFNNVTESGAVDRGGNAAPVLPLPTPAQEKEIAALREQVSALEKQSAEIQKKLGKTATMGESSPELKKVTQDLAAARKRLESANKAVLTTMVMEERPGRRDTFVLVRGAYDKYGEKVSPGVPEQLAPLSKGASNDRLGLAYWLVDPANPLTARVIANRYWQLFFGIGLVKTSEDFGVQGEPPTHPELLDYLATELVRSKWDLKRLHHLIVTSATYRQGSALSPALRERDPDNRLLARGPRFRLSSLAIRDQALALGGLLYERQGGPPVKPYQPPGIWEELSFGRVSYKQDKAPEIYRRSLYVFWRRTVGPASFFDTPSRQVCVVRPSRTNTPLHALVTLNDPAYVEAARALAERVMSNAGSPEERIDLAFRLATARHPSAREQAVLLGAYRRLSGQYRNDPNSALELLKVGEMPRNPKLDPGDLAAYTALASLILNLDEVITRE